MRLTLIGLWLLALPAFASEPVEFRSDREGKSYYSSNSDRRQISRALKDVDERQITGAFDELKRDLEVNNLCSFNIAISLEQKLKLINPRFDQMEGAILYLRSQNAFDDNVTKILLTSQKTLATNIQLPKQRNELTLPTNKKVVDDAVKVLSNFERKLQNQCFDEAYKSLYNDILKYDKSLKSRHLEAIFVEAYEKKVISYNTFLAIEQARVNELETLTLTLKSYYKKIF